MEGLGEKVSWEMVNEKSPPPGCPACDNLVLVSEEQCAVPVLYTEYH